MIRLTAEAHRIVRAVVQPGDTALDATAGNGHDTLVLAQCVGPTGRVIAIDIQATAIACTRVRLEDHGIQNVELIHGDHAQLADWCPQPLAVAMFNLGYLPHGDHRLTTRIESTLPALRAAVSRLRPGGVVTILAYRGHPGGLAETAAVAHTCEQLRQQGYLIEQVEATATSPVLFVIRRPNHPSDSPPDDLEAPHST